MKKGILLLILTGSITANAQTLKEALYSGKLRSDSNTVIRKGDDLKSKMDTVAKKKPELTEKAKIGVSPLDSTMKVSPGPGDSVAAQVEEKKEVVASPKDNNKIWKEFMDSLVTTFKEEVLPNKKIKDGTYYLLVEYEIGTDGQTSVTNVSCTPENSWLQDQVKQRVTLTSPRLNPIMTSNGVARKVTRKYNFTVTKQ